MSDSHLVEQFLTALDPKEKSWSGSPSPAGSLRNVPLEIAVRRITL